MDYARLVICALVAATVFILDVVNVVQVSHNTWLYTTADKNAHITLVVLRGVLILLLAVAAFEEEFHKMIRSRLLLNSLLTSIVLYTATLPFAYFALRANAKDNHNMRSNSDSIILVQLPFSTFFSGIAMAYVVGGLDGKRK